MSREGPAKKPAKKRAGKARRRVGSKFEQWLKDNGYTRGKSGWLSPDKKKFFPF